MKISTRKENLLKVMFLIAVASLFLAASTMARAATFGDDWEIISITDDYANDILSSVYDGEIAWAKHDGSTTKTVLRPSH